MMLTGQCLMDIKNFILSFTALLICACKMGGAQAAPVTAWAADAYGYEQNIAATRYAGTGFNGSTGAVSAYNSDMPAEIQAAQVPAENPAENRKLIKRADLRIRVENPEATEKPLTDLIEKYNAWTASAGIYENSRNYSIRVPAVYYDEMLAEIISLGRLLRHTENAEDVTLRYYDLESRLATKRELLKTYQGYLARASSIDEIMTVEYRIAELQQEIDQTGTQFRNLVNLVDYSTINVDITGPASTSSYSEPSLKDKMAELFGSFGDVASSVLVILTGVIIYGVPAVLVIVLLFWILFGRIGLLKKLWRLAAGKRK